MTGSSFHTISGTRSANPASRPLRVGLILGTDAMTQSQLMARIAESPDYLDRHQLFGNNDAKHVLGIVDRNMIELENLVIARNYLKLRRKDNLNYYDVLFNAISDPDANPESLRQVARLAKQTDRPWINHPRNIAKTTRDGVARALSGIYRIKVPRTTRIGSLSRSRLAQAITQMGIDFPVLVRRAGTQTGETLQRLDSLDQLNEQAAEKGDWYVTEFIDFRGPDGLYVKYRAFVIGDKVTISHVFPSESWMVHWRSVAQLIEKNPESSMLGTYESVGNRVDQLPALEETMLAIRDVLKLDYFGVDFAAQDGSLLLFEANAAMNHFPVERYGSRVVIGDMISSLVDLVCQTAYGVRSPKRRQPLPRRNAVSPAPNPSIRQVTQPNLPVEVAVLIGADSAGAPAETEDGADYPGALEWTALFRQLEAYIDRNLIKFRVFDVGRDLAEISDRLRDGRTAIAFNLTSDPLVSPGIYETLSELHQAVETIWINDPTVSAAAADLYRDGSVDESALVIVEGGGHTADKHQRRFRLLFIGDRASIVDFSVHRNGDSDAGSSANLIAGDEALMQQEREALIGNSLSEDPTLLADLQALRASIEADVFGLDCARLADGRIAILRLDPSCLTFPFDKYRGLPAWRPAAALSRLIHQRATGIA